MARKKNTETPVTEDIQAQDPTVTLETPVVSNTESETQEKDTVESPDETTLKEPSPKKGQSREKSRYSRICKRTVTEVSQLSCIVY